MGITYLQNWKAYDKSQTTEKEGFMELLDDLCGSVEQPQYKFGRTSLPLRDMKMMNKAVFHKDIPLV